MITLVSLLKTYAPYGVYFNENGVCMYGYMYTFKTKYVQVDFKVIQVNGLWYGARSYMLQLFGYSSPLSELYAKPYATLEELVNALWKDTLFGVTSGFKHHLVGYGKTVLKALHTESERMLSNESLLSEFKEKSFYHA